MQYHPSLLPSQALLLCPSGSPCAQPDYPTLGVCSQPLPIMTSVLAPSTGQLHSPRGHETLHRYHEVQWEFPSEQAESGKCSGQGPRARSFRPEGNPPAMILRDLSSQSEGGAPPRLPHVASAEARLTTLTSRAGVRRDGSALAGTDRRPQHKQVVGREDLAITQ